MLDLSQPAHVHAAQRLRNDRIIWLGTVRPDGRPHLVPVWFLWDGSAIWIFSQPGQQKLRNIRQNPHVILALDNTNEHGGDVVVIEGRATLLTEPTSKVIPAAYIEKYGQRIRALGFSDERMQALFSQPILIEQLQFKQVGSQVS